MMQRQDNDQSTSPCKSSFTPLDMQQWTEIVKQWDQSNETQQAYCNRLNINIHTFSYVRSKLNRKKAPTTSFIPVTVAPISNTVGQHSMLVFENKHGLKLSMPLTVSNEQLSQLLKLIGWRHD